MSEQTPAGWYPDAQGTTRYWDGSAWTEHTHDRGAGAAVPTADKKDGAFAKLKKAAADRSAEKREAKEARDRKWAEDVAAAGALVTSGTFGMSTVEIYEGGYVRVASGEQPERPTAANVRSQMAANLSGGGINAKRPYEKLRSITFTPADSDQGSYGGSGLESAVGPAVAGLLKGTKHLMKTSAPGLAAAGIAHIASAGSRTSYLTIATDRQIYTLSNQIPNSVGLKTAKKGHVDVGLALEAAGNTALGIDSSSTADTGAAALPPATQPEAAVAAQPSAPSLADRLRELATLHQEGILSEEEFASAKAKLLSGL
ncbi:DUF2510 domain-containing protein [Nocardioides sp. LHG3406-4]|uniref:DUF2510 domain-containing protein n=1 Tax=Nocardioides sp. LHG3406-4 TaxID=2804575 RepID=UPI003CED5410